jgi:hypothetical protein
VKPNGGVPCRVCTLPPEVRAVVEGTLAQPSPERRVSLTQLAALLKDQGFTVGDSSLQKHAAHHINRR